MKTEKASTTKTENYSVRLTAIPGIPNVVPGDDIAELIAKATASAELTPDDGDILVLAHKIVSKAEGRLQKLSEVKPSHRAHEISVYTEKDPRLVELILRESDHISRMRPGLLIVRHRLGFTSANAGIDRSNVVQESEEETVLLLPEDPDRSAAQIRTRMGELTGKEIGIVIADSHGRPFRLGTVGVAIGVAGVPALWDRRGEQDLFGYKLQHTEVGTADEIAAAGSLIMGQGAEGTPAVLIQGLFLPRSVGPTDDLLGTKPLAGTQAKDLIRSQEFDLYQ